MGSNGLPSSTDLQIYCDAMASIFKYIKTPLGLGLSSESGTPSIAYQAQLCQQLIEGDGSTIYGIANAPLQSGAVQDLKNIYLNSRYDVYSSGQFRNRINALDQAISTNLPKVLTSGAYSSWNLTSTGLHPFDSWLHRINGNDTNAPAKPTGTPVLTATTGGAIQSNIAGGVAPRFVYTFVGANDWWESLPSTVATQVALNPTQNAYTVTGIQNPIPTGVTKIRLYRGLVSGGAGVYYWVTDIPCAAGLAPPSITLIQPDISLRQDVVPPSYASCLMLPEFATLFSICYGNLSSSSADVTSGFQFSSNSFLGHTVVAAGRVDQILGYNNTQSSGTFATWASTTKTFGALLQSNDYTQGLQGYVGAANSVQARVTSVLDANAVLTSIGYHYLDSTHQTPTTGTITGPLTLNLALGSTVDLAIPGGQIVTSIDSFTSTISTTGTYLFEAKPLRVI